MEKKIEEAEGKVKSHKLQHDKNINELCQEIEFLREQMRDYEDRSRCNNLKVDALKEVENEKQKQTDRILQEMIHDELQLEVLGIERAHRVGNKSNKRNAQRTIVPKLYSYKDKQIVLSVAIKLKGKNQTLKETPVHQSRKTGQK